MNDYFTADDAKEYSFYRIPKPLILNPDYRSVPVEAKMLYGLMLDRIGLSARSGWVDEQDRVYIYFSMAEIMDQLQCGHNKAVRLLKELDQGMGLIRRKKQGLGRPNRIYVMNFISGNDNKTSDYRNSGSDDTHSDVLFGDFQTSENGNSGVFGTDFGLPHEDFKTSDHGNSDQKS